jgi:hypothetical protein
MTAVNYPTSYGTVTTTESATALPAGAQQEHVAPAAKAGTPGSGTTR